VKDLIDSVFLRRLGLLLKGKPTLNQIRETKAIKVSRRFCLTMKGTYLESLAISLMSSQQVEMVQSNAITNARKGNPEEKPS
jgi:hypothetical protein